MKQVTEVNLRPCSNVISRNSPAEFRRSPRWIPGPASLAYLREMGMRFFPQKTVYMHLPSTFHKFTVCKKNPTNFESAKLDELSRVDLHPEPEFPHWGLRLTSASPEIEVHQRWWLRTPHLFLNIGVLEKHLQEAHNIRCLGLKPLFQTTPIQIQFISIQSSI